MNANPTQAQKVSIPRLSRVESLLLERGVVDMDTLRAARARQRGAKKPLLEVLLEQEAVDEELVVREIARATGARTLTDEELVPDPDIQSMVPADVVQRLGILPLRLHGTELVVATGDPFQVLSFDELRQLTGRELRVMLARPRAVRKAIQSARGEEEVLHALVKNASPLAESIELVDVPESGPKDFVDVERLMGSEAPTVQLVNLIVSDAIRSGASDIHIEAEKASMRVRFRIDGELRDALNAPVRVHASVVARIKIVARLDIIETRRPQDGRAKVSQGDRTYDLRISTLPSYFGEKVVIRILDPNAATFDLDRCGIEAPVLRRWRELSRRPNGLLLMTGPTGSGKTSTLFASLLELRDPAVNIVTVEDPVEYQFEGITHVPVRSEIGVSFAAALRSILRQDPDIVMVGEIRDAETARTCLQAAMTGHLVLSTLHTNDAVGAIPRLIDLGADPSLVASSLLGVMAQRLARTVCTSCAQPYEVPATQLALLGRPAGGPPVTGRRGVGCSQCRGAGLKGRTALVELVVATPALQEAIARQADRAELLAIACADGTSLLAESGLRKVEAGICTPDEVLEVAAGEVTGQSSDAPATAATPVAAAEPSLDTSAPAVTGVVDEPPPALRCPQCEMTVQSSWSFCPGCSGPLSSSGGASAVVCDDDPVTRRVVAAALRSTFTCIQEAASGQEALDLIARSAPDLLVIDQQMPGLSGVDVIRELRSSIATTALPIIMLTALTDEEMEEASLEAGANDYLRKPVSVTRLRSRAKAVVATHRRLLSAAD